MKLARPAPATPAEVLGTLNALWQAIEGAYADGVPADVLFERVEAALATGRAVCTMMRDDTPVEMCGAVP